MRLFGKFRQTTLPDSIVSFLGTFAGLILGLNMVPSLALATGSGKETYGLTGEQGKPITGIIVHVQGNAGEAPSKLLVDTVRVSPSGRPDCRKPTGHLVEVLTGNMEWSRRSHGSLVVTGDRETPPSLRLSVGDCLSVKGPVVDRLRDKSDENRIRIVPSIERSNRSIRMIQADMFRLWPEHPSREARRKHSSPKSSPSLPHSPLPQKA